MLHRKSPRFRRLVRIRRTNHSQTRYRPQTGQLFHRLVRGTILPHADTVMRENIKRLQSAERAQPNRRLHIIREHQERRAERQHSAMRRHPVHRRAHGMFAYPERDIAPRIAPLAAHRAHIPGPANSDC